MNARLRNIILLVIGGVLLSSAWPPINFFLGLMVGFVPLLLVEHQIAKQKVKWHKSRVYWSAYLCFAVWNFCGIWWSSNAAWIAVIAEVVINSMFFSFVFLFFSQVKKHLGQKLGYFFFVFSWLAFEYIEIQDWDLAWSWLTMGYGLSDHTWMIQWYEYSGALGGSMWLLLLNLIVFKAINFFRDGNSLEGKKQLLKGGFVFSIPILISLLMYFTHEEKGETGDFVVVQPNIDPYTENFMDKKGKYLDAYRGRRGRMKRLMKLGEKELDENVDFILYPESAFATTIWEGEENNNWVILNFREWLKKYPKLNVVGGVGYKTLYKGDPKKELPPDVHRSVARGTLYHRYNSSICINNSDSIQVYHKSKLVIGVEQIPPYFVFLQRYLTDFDHDKGASIYNPNNSIQDNREVFVGDSTQARLAPVVCFEVNFGEFMSGYVKEGANVLGVVTNEGWWGDTPGYKHLFAYSRARAIETRRSIARSANTGWSGFINQRGDVIKRSEFWEPAVLRSTLRLNNEQTFYMRFGDILGRLSVPFSILLLMNLVIKLIRKKSKTVI